MSEKATNLCLNRILVVDDTTANLQLLTNLLTEQGYTVHPASDGELALEFVRSTLPDLILHDIKMPGMDGFEVCRRLKTDERTYSIPIIFKPDGGQNENQSLSKKDYWADCYRPAYPECRHSPHLCPGRQ